MIVDGVIITYNPDVAHFAVVIERLAKQVHRLIVVDNGSERAEELLDFEESNVVILKQNENLGIAAATNIGFDYAAKDGCDFILLTDQDTVYPKDYISRFNELSAEFNDADIAVYCPAIYDEVSNQKKHVYILKNDRIVNYFPCESQAIFQSIASGMIIKTECLHKILGMNEDLFIDMVDFEWCWRVNFYGYKIWYLNDLIILHSLGASSEKVFGMVVNVRNSLRYYYLIRNSIYLAINTPYLKKKTKLFLFGKGLKYFCGYIFITKFKSFHLLLSAVVDGLRGKLGRYNQNAHSKHSSL